MMIGGIGAQELVLILLVVFLLFGAKRKTESKSGYLCGSQPGKRQGFHGGHLCRELSFAAALLLRLCHFRGIGRGYIYRRKWRENSRVGGGKRSGLGSVWQWETETYFRRFF